MSKKSWMIIALKIVATVFLIGILSQMNDRISRLPSESRGKFLKSRNYLIQQLSDDGYDAKQTKVIVDFIGLQIYESDYQICSFLRAQLVSMLAIIAIAVPLLGKQSTSTNSPKE